MSDTNKLKFKNVLENINWNDILSGITDTNTQVIKFLDTIEQHYFECFPMKTKQNK